MTNREKLLTVKGGLIGVLKTARNDQQRLGELFVAAGAGNPFVLRISFYEKMITLLTEVIESEPDDDQANEQP